MKFEISWTKHDEPVARRSDKAPMTPDDRAEVKQLLAKMLCHEVCWNCGREWSDAKDIAGNPVKVCWSCAKTV